MKRFLSLALVLIMVIGIMPTALAADCTGEHTWVVDPENSKAPTCTAEGVAAEKCSVEGCSATQTSPIAKIDHTIADDAWTETAPTCVAEGKKSAVCSVCGNTVEQILPATGVHTFVEGKCSVCGEVEVVEKPVYAASAANIELLVGASATVKIAYTLNGAAAEVKPTAVAFASSDSKIASVNSTTGEVTGVAKGTATITATVSGVNETDLVVTCTVKVEDGAVIVCEDRETDKDTCSIGPTLQIDGKIVKDAEFSFKVDGYADYSTTGGSVLVLEKDRAEIVKVTISVKSFTGSDGKAGDPDLVADKTIYVSFYDEIDIEATVDSDVSNFMFDQTGVFSEVEVDGRNVAKVSGYSLLAVLGANDADWYRVYLTQVDPTTDVGAITYPGSVSINAFDKNAVNSYSTLNISNLKFSCMDKGEFEVLYTLEDKDTGLTVQEGMLTIIVKEAGADIELSTSFGKDLVLDEDDFEDLWDDADTSGKLDYVTFDVSGMTGDLLVDDSKNALDVTAKMEFYFDYDKNDDGYDLDEVVYAPYAKATKAYEERISFTCYGEKKGEELHGVLLIKVGEQVSFTDVKKTDYFYEAVEWAVNNGVTSGTGKNTFSPNKTCTRAEVVTFLWRAAGEPDVTGYLPFTDVDDDSYYYEAVLWAYKNDITTGLTATTFGPHSTVTRGQVVTFLWRAMDKITVSATNPFADVKTSDYYYKAVLWAVKNDVTTGLSATSFGPNSGCTRGQIVTFLYRAYEGE